MPDGASATVVGVLTTGLGSLESGRSGFLQDETAGIAVYLDAALDPVLDAGTRVRLSGTLDERYGARTLRVAQAAIEELGTDPLPDPLAVSTGDVGEAVEGLRVTVAGPTSGSPTTYADGLGVLVDDGTGPVRVIVGPDALDGASLPSGTLVIATGPVGQRDSSGTGAGGYRVHATLTGELVVVPSPTPSPSANPSPLPSSSPTPAPTVSPAPSASPPDTMPIAAARSQPVGTTVTVAGVIVAEAGRLGTPPLLAIADASGGIVVRVPEGVAAPGRGALVEVTGALADPYGQLELRPSASGFRVTGSGPLPAPVAIQAAGLGEATEGRLVSIVGTVTGSPRKSTSGDLAIDLADPSGTPFRAMTDASSGFAASDLRSGETYQLIGIVGQRASKKGVLDGYRVWLRDRADAEPAPGDSGTGSTPGSSTSDAGVAIAVARGLDDDAPATVVGVVIAGAGLLDADGRRIVIQDATGGIEVYLPADLPAPILGSRIRVDGTVGHAWGAPRLRAAAVTELERNVAIGPRSLGGAPDESVEWQLVRIAGTITDVTRLGDRWRADVRVGTTSMLITGLAGAGIASTLLVEGRTATIVGIVRRPYPTSTDRRWTVVPRGPWDVAVGPTGSVGGTSGGDGAGGAGVTVGGGARLSAYEAAPVVDLATLADHLGERVRVGGLVAGLVAGGFLLDDGSAIAGVGLTGDAATFLDLIAAGDALGIVGRIELGPDAVPWVVASDPGGLVRLGSLGEVVPLAADVAPSPDASVGPVATARLAAPFPDLDGGLIGVGGLILASFGSLLVGVIRRHRAHVRVQRALTLRLDQLRGPSERA